MKAIEELEDHYVVCGYGRMGSFICREFDRRGIPFVVVEMDPVTKKRILDSGYLLSPGDATDEAVLHGAGGHFSSGFDLKAMSDEATEWLRQTHFGQGRDDPSLGPMGPTRLALRKPVIAAVAGAAVAGGMELALWCDYRIMESSAYMGVFCRRWGVPLIDGGTVRLPRHVGLGRARELILTGRRVDADEALRIGLCEYVVDEGAALSTALAQAADLRGNRWPDIEGHRAEIDDRDLAFRFTQTDEIAQQIDQRFRGGAQLRLEHEVVAPVVHAALQAQQELVELAGQRCLVLAEVQGLLVGFIAHRVEFVD